MGIKIKKKTSSDEPEILEGEIDGEGFDNDVDALPEEDEVAVVLPAFTGGKKRSMLEDNPKVIFAGVAVVALLVVAGFGVVEFLESQRLEASKSLNPAFQAYLLEVEGSPSLEPLKQRDNLKLPTLHADEETKWKAVYDASSAATSTDVKDAAKLMKAASAVHLDKHEEAATIYADVAKSPELEPSLKLAAELGQVNAHASAEEWDKALEALARAEAGGEDIAKLLRYQRARLLEASGKVKEAKELYHEIIESEPTNIYKADIERRLAIL